jgi:hypothetical protein
MTGWGGRTRGAGVLDPRQAGLGEFPSGEILIYGFYANDGDTSLSYRRELTATASLGFGGGARGEAIGTHIKVNEFNGSLHIVDDSTVTPNDTCIFPHLHVIKKALNTVTGCYVDESTEIELNYDTPLPGKGLMAHYSTSTSIEITSCNIWAGTGGVVNGNVENCQFWMTELSRGDGLHKWVRPSYGSALVLTTADGESGYNFYWYFAISVLPSAAGFTNTNKVKFEVNYS